MAIMKTMGEAIRAFLNSPDGNRVKRTNRPRYLYQRTDKVHCVQRLPKNGQMVKHFVVRAFLVPTSKYVPGPSIPGGLRRRMARGGVA